MEPRVSPLDCGFASNPLCRPSRSAPLLILWLRAAALSYQALRRQDFRKTVSTPRSPYKYRPYLISGVDPMWGSLLKCLESPAAAFLFQCGHRWSPFFRAFWRRRRSFAAQPHPLILGAPAISSNSLRNATDGKLHRIFKKGCCRLGDARDKGRGASRRVFPCAASVFFRPLDEYVKATDCRQKALSKRSLCNFVPHGRQTQASFPSAMTGRRSCHERSGSMRISHVRQTDPLRTHHL